MLKKFREVKVNLYILMKVNVRSNQMIYTYLQVPQNNHLGSHICEKM